MPPQRLLPSCCSCTNALTRWFNWAVAPKRVLVPPTDALGYAASPLLLLPGKVSSTMEAKLADFGLSTLVKKMDRSTSERRATVSRMMTKRTR